MSKPVSLFIAACTLATVATPAAAENGEHPAVIAKRLYEQAPYDYASKFYPHPAWLHLSAHAPDDATVADKRGSRRRETATDKLVAAQRAAHIDSGGAR